MLKQSAMAREVAERQVAMFGMFVGRGLKVTRAALTAASGVPESSLREYAAGDLTPARERDDCPDVTTWSATAVVRPPSK